MTDKPANATEALRECPFCGGEAIHVIAAQPKHARYVMCTQCNNGTAMADTREQAADLWNARAVLAEPPKEVAALIERLRVSARWHSQRGKEKRLDPMERHKAMDYDDEATMLFAAADALARLSAQVEAAEKDAERLAKRGQHYRDEMEKAQAAAAPVPAREWIPAEPTDEMIKYGLQAMRTNNVRDSSEQGRIKRIWQAMYNRRPSSTSGG